MPDPVAPQTLAEAAREIVEVGRYLSARDLVPATSGNFSRRLNEDWIGVTRSGVDKGELMEADILPVPLSEPLPGGTSAETPLHLALYRDRPEVGAVLHIHSHAATLISQMHEASGELIFRGYEMQKAFAGQTTHAAAYAVPVFPNSQDIPTLATEVSARLAREPAAVGYLLAGHGLYAWGKTIAEARRHVMAFEFLMTCDLHKRRLGP
jgi:methylthioribulose-1-phosphate dehydratase